MSSLDRALQRSASACPSGAQRLAPGAYKGNGGMAQRQRATTLDSRDAKQVAAFEQELVRVFDIYVIVRHSREIRKNPLKIARRRTSRRAIWLWRERDCR